VLIQKILKDKKPATSPPSGVPAMRRPNEIYLHSCMEGVDNE